MGLRLVVWVLVRFDQHVYAFTTVHLKVVEDLRGFFAAL
jgi:hypothetical protein